MTSIISDKPHDSIQGMVKRKQIAECMKTRNIYTLINS